jgi:hypothetical protein
MAIGPSRDLTLKTTKTPQISFRLRPTTTKKAIFAARRSIFFPPSSSFRFSLRPAIEPNVPREGIFYRACRARQWNGISMEQCAEGSTHKYPRTKKFTRKDARTQKDSRTEIHTQRARTQREKTPSTE